MTNPYHPRSTHVHSAASLVKQPVTPLAYTMTVQQVLDACRCGHDPVLPLVASLDAPTLLGALMRAQLIEWFTIEVHEAALIGPSFPQSLGVPPC